MGFLEVIRMMVFFIILMFVWFVGRIFVLPQIEVLLPSLPPYPIWRSIYKIVLGICNAVFHYILIFFLIMYVIYLVIKMFVPNFPIPFKTILLALTPLYELRVSGIFGLLDAIIGIIFSTIPLPDRVIRLGNALGRFFSGSFIALMNMFGANKRKKSAQPPPPPEEGVANFEDTDADEPTDDPQLTAAENKYVDKEYHQCLSENYVPKVEGASYFESLRNDIGNSSARTICKLRKTQTLANLISAKL